MGLFSPNPTKQKQIELQNILFDTNEKKLMVSVEFLEDMTTKYVSKRMKNVNKMNTGMVATKTPRHFFAYYDILIHDLDELIAIEPYHTFKKPTPSEFKKMINDKMNKYIEAMINRTWKEANHKFGLDLEGKREPFLYGPVLEDILKFRDKYSTTMMELIDKFYRSVYGMSIEERETALLGIADNKNAPEEAEATGDQPIPDPDDELMAAENSDSGEDEAGAPEDTDDDGFVETVQ